MNPEIKKKWVDALRSGNYGQDKEHLRTTDGFCCLGVLCDLAVAEGLDIKVQEPEVGSERGEYEYDYNTTYLPISVQTWAEIAYNPKVPASIVPDTYGRDFSSHVEVDLADLNDAGMPFSEIADLIEKGL